MFAILTQVLDSQLLPGSVSNSDGAQSSSPNAKRHLWLHKDTQGLGQSTVLAGQRVLSLSPAVRNLFPDGGLRRGSTVVVSGSTCLALLTIATASAEGSWCAAVNMANLGVDAAVEAGVCLKRLALVPEAGKQWVAVTSALVEAVDVVLVRPPGNVSHTDARRLTAKARECGAVLVPVVDNSNSWPLADLRLKCQGFVMNGLFEGYGYLAKPRLMVSVVGRGKASVARQAMVALAS